VAVTFLFDESPEAQAIAVEALPPGASLAVGSVRADRTAPRRRLHNSLLFFGPDGAPLGAYDKRHLAPFGEYVPYAWVLGRIGLGTLGDGLSGFTPGDGAQPPRLPGLPPLAAMICYEVIFPGFARAAAANAGWGLQVTNDAWFGESAGPWQHLAQARVRAVELGLPIARAANTGVSAMIDPWGRLTATLGLGERGVIDSPLPGPRIETAYGRLGDWPPLALAAIAFALSRLRRAKNPSDGCQRR
jgi:apolipoprotein N-acyltransferase